MCKSKKLIHFLARNDKNLKAKLVYINSTEPNHVEKRKAQRAITHLMMQITVTYGVKEHSHGAIRYKLTDRCLKGTVYEKVTDKLRGLSVISIRQNSTTYGIVTTYWDTKIKRKTHGNNRYRSRI